MEGLGLEVARGSVRSSMCVWRGGGGKEGEREDKIHV